MARDRTPCCVPFCRRWQYGDPNAEWMCWDHWKRIPIARRRAYHRAVAERVPQWVHRPDRMPRWMLPRPRRSRDQPRSIVAIFRLWDRLKRMAIEKAL